MFKSHAQSSLFRLTFNYQLKWSELLTAINLLESESASKLLYDWRFTVNQFVLATSPFRLKTRDLFVQLNNCGHSPYVISSLIEDGSVFCNCCWLSLAQSFSGPSPAGLMTTLLSQIRDSQTWRDRSPYLYSQGHGGPVIHTGSGFPFRRFLRLAGQR
jgi:hypothetical protein